ncbi:HNH endonuclease [Chitinophaga barathri]|uniref:HNH endonuclease n=1 Tax=Chitinophaga barathri TaxID=1647451 RepID=A0A3N4M871_9BACT|nr:HNH endonuclease [Chitinophaga barathri]RPD39435.1 HNH endonuclease [Chitinophaga barathri]
MVNLVVPVFDSLKLFQVAVDGKTDRVAQASLTAAIPLITSRYQVFDNHNLRNELELLTQDAACNALREELLSLYEFGKPVVQQILNTLQAAQNRTVRHTCQYCTIGSIKSLDHIVNKGDYPEYSIHPQNLIPCCLECNINKGRFWVHGGNRLFINLYTDELPKEQYLFTNITGNIAELDFDFELRQPKGIDIILWNRIVSHYNRMKLLGRLRHKAISEVTELLLLAKKTLECGTTKADIIDIMLQQATISRREYGANHWKASMVESLADSALFWQHVHRFRL